MKKLLTMLMALALTLSLAACGGSEPAPAEQSAPAPAASADAPEVSGEPGFVPYEGNGLSFVMPEDVEYVKTAEESGSIIFADADGNVVITISAKAEAPGATAGDITEDLLLDGISGGGGLEEAVLESYGAVDHEDGSTGVAAFGYATMPDGRDMHSDLQYYFVPDGSGYYMISYLYSTNTDNSLLEGVTTVMGSMSVAE